MLRRFRCVQIFLKPTTKVTIGLDYSSLCYIVSIIVSDRCREGNLQVFAAVLNVALQRFSEEPAILAELVHLKEPSTSMGPEPALDYVHHRAVWGMLYADDACIESRDHRRGSLR